jgi:hypothetical protein
MAKKKAIKTPEKPILQAENGAFLPGTAPGPGRPPGTFSLVTLLKNKLQEVPKEEQRSYAERLISKMLDDAINRGDAAAQRLIWNYVEGLPRADLNLTGNLFIELTDYEREQNPSALQLPAEAVSVRIHDGTPEVQDSSVPPQSGEKQNSVELTDLPIA